MVSIPFALSVSHFINTVGADAGFAAIIGLALLVLLFFAQMRETSHLRDQVADATDHVSHLEYQLTQLSRGAAGTAVASAPSPGVAPRPAARPATGAQPAVPAAAPVGARTVAAPRPRVDTVAPIAPAGVGAPALASATRLIPSFDDGPISVHQAGAGVSAEGVGRRDAGVMDPPGPPPATPAGGARNGSATNRATPPPAAAGAPRMGQAVRPPAPRGSRSPGAVRAPRRTGYGAKPRSRLRGLLAALIALVVVGAIVVALLLLTGSSSPSSRVSSTATASRAPTSRRTHHATTIKPSSVTVAVLNGTSTPNLAHEVSVKLGGDGYRLGNIATATDQTHTATVVAYLPGHRAAAEVVAKSLGVGLSAISAADQSSQAVACPPGAACAAKVIVTVGSDLASAAGSSTAPAAASGTGTSAAAGAAAGTSTG